MLWSSWEGMPEGFLTLYIHIRFHFSFGLSAIFSTHYYSLHKELAVLADVPIDWSLLLAASKITSAPKAFLLQQKAANPTLLCVAAKTLGSRVSYGIRDS